MTTWLRKQKLNYEKNKINNNQLQILWEKFLKTHGKYMLTEEDKWLLNLKKLNDFFQKNKRAPKSRELNERSEYNWYRKQKTNYLEKKGLLKNDELRKNWVSFLNKYAHLRGKN